MCTKYVISNMTHYQKKKKLIQWLGVNLAKLNLEATSFLLSSGSIGGQVYQIQKGSIDCSDIARWTNLEFLILNNRENVKSYNGLQGYTRRTVIEYL